MGLMNMTITQIMSVYSTLILWFELTFERITVCYIQALSVAIRSLGCTLLPLLLWFSFISYESNNIIIINHFCYFHFCLFCFTHRLHDLIRGPLKNVKQFCI